MQFEDYSLKKIVGIEMNDWKIHNLNLFEILAQLKKSGAEVSYFNMAPHLYPEFGTLYGEEKISSRNKSSCLNLSSIIAKEFNLEIIDLSDSNIALSRFGTLSTYFSLQDYDSEPTSLKNLCYKGFNYGNSVLSTIYSDVKSSEVPKYLFRAEFFRISSLWIQLFDYFEAFFLKYSFDTLVIFNGRFFAENAAVSAASKLDMKILYHESSGRPHSYNLDCFSPLSISDAALAFQTIEQSNTPEEISNIGQEWFKERLSGAAPELLKLHSTWREGAFKSYSDQKIATFFTTSDDEFLGLGSDWNFGRHENQLEAASHILSILKQAGYFTIVRVHPNARNKARRMTKQWLDLGSVDQVILPSSKVDSYELIMKSDLVVVAGSTIGIEAVYLGVPSATVGSSLYEGLNALLDFREVNNVEALEKKLQNYCYKDLKFKALTYAYWESSRLNFRKLLVPENNVAFSDKYEESITTRIYFYGKRKGYKLLLRVDSIFRYYARKNWVWIKLKLS